MLTHRDVMFFSCYHQAAQAQKMLAMEGDNTTILHLIYYGKNVCILTKVYEVKEDSEEGILYEKSLLILGMDGTFHTNICEY